MYGKPDDLDLIPLISLAAVAFVARFAETKNNSHAFDKRRLISNPDVG
jgi:hypothetical protein